MKFCDELNGNNEFSLKMVITIEFVTTFCLDSGLIEQSRSPKITPINHKSGPDLNLESQKWLLPLSPHQNFT